MKTERLNKAGGPGPIVKKLNVLMHALIEVEHQHDQLRKAIDAIRKEAHNLRLDPGAAVIEAKTWNLLEHRLQAMEGKQ